MCVCASACVCLTPFLFPNIFSLSGVRHFFLKNWVSIWHCFLLACIIYFSIRYGRVLFETLSFTFALLNISLFCLLLFLENNSTRLEFQIDVFPYLNTSKMSFLCFLVSVVSREKLQFLLLFPLCNVSYFHRQLLRFSLYVCFSVV